MSSHAFVTSPRVALLSAFVFLGAELRAWTAAGIIGALGVVKMLGAPALVVAILLAAELMYRSMPPNVQLPQNLLALNRRVLFFLICVIDLWLLAVIVLGIPFLAIMTRE